VSARRAGFHGPAAVNLLVLGLILGSAALVYAVPRSILAFMAFQGSLLAIYYVRLPPRAKLAYAVLALGLVMPFLGVHNGYYMEVAIQVGIFVALALGLNIVVRWRRPGSSSSCCWAWPWRR
jgi:hypothetical protein